MVNILQFVYCDLFLYFILYNYGISIGKKCFFEVGEHKALPCKKKYVLVSVLHFLDVVERWTITSLYARCGVHHQPEA